MAAHAAAPLCVAGGRGALRASPQSHYSLRVAAMSASKSEVEGRGPVAPVLAGLLIAAAPVVFALATWDVTNLHSPIRAWMRFYGAPVIAIEILVIICALFSGFQPLRMLRAAPAWAQATLVVLITVAFCSAFVAAPDEGTAVGRTFLWLIHLLFGLGFAHLVRRCEPFFSRHFWPAVVVGLCGYVVLLMFFVWMIPDPATFGWAHLRLAVVNIRQVGFYSAVGAAAALGLSFFQSRWILYIAWGAAASLLLAISFWSGTRGSILAVWIACLAAMVWYPPLRTLFAIGTVAACNAIGAVLSLVHSVPDSHYGMARLAVSAATRTAEDFSSGRLSQWLGAVRAVRERPLFGYGESQFRLIVPESMGAYNHPHNAVLQIALQWGVVGTVCFGALAGLVLWWCHLAVREGRKEDLPPFLVLVSLLAMSLYEGTLYHTYPIMMIAVSIAAIVRLGPAFQKW